VDQIVSVPDVICAGHVPFKPHCLKVVTFLFVYLQKVLVSISIAPFKGNLVVFKQLIF